MTDTTLDEIIIVGKKKDTDLAELLDMYGDDVKELLALAFERGRQDAQGRSITQAVYDLAIKDAYEKGRTETITQYLNCNCMECEKEKATCSCFLCVRLRTDKERIAQLQAERKQLADALEAIKRTDKTPPEPENNVECEVCNAAGGWIVCPECHAEAKKALEVGKC